MKGSSMKNSITVYSTSFGRICGGCNHPIGECVCKQATKKISGDGIIRVSVERKGRKGKTVTLLTGFNLSVNQLDELARHLKKICGAGGSVKENDILIQGDHRELILEELPKHGYVCKKAGG